MYIPKFFHEQVSKEYLIKKLKEMYKKDNKKTQDEQLPQDAVMQSVFKIMSFNSELERFKSREKAQEVCEWYQGKGFPNARVEETVA